MVYKVTIHHCFRHSQSLSIAILVLGGSYPRRGLLARRLAASIGIVESHRQAVGRQVGSGTADRRTARVAALLAIYTASK